MFIFATVGLLAWALVKPYVVKWRESRKSVGMGRGQYAAVSGQEGET